MNASDPTRPAPPPDDGALVRYLDGELSDAEARAVEEAAASDAEVRGRLERLRALTRETGTLLETVEVPPLPPRRMEPGEASSAPSRGPTGSGRAGRGAAWRRAAVLVLLGGGLGGAVVAAAVPGVGERVAWGVARAVWWMSGGSSGPEAPGEATTRVAFPVSGPAFTVTFEGAVEGGLVTVGRASDADAVARVGGGSPALRVEPDGLRVVGWGAGMELEVRLPAAVETLRLHVGDAPERTVSLASLSPGGGTLRVPLVP